MSQLNKKIAIAGAGISGISIASMLQKENSVTVFEKNKVVGGLVHCDRVDGVLYHRVGGHVFNSKNAKVLDWFWKKFNKETEFIPAKRNAKIFFKNAFIGYPIENYLYQMNSELVTQIMKELLEINKIEQKDPMSYVDFETFLKSNFGSTLYEIYFKPYNEKIWRTDLSRVSMPWLEGKLPMPRLLDIVTNNIHREEEATMVHASFFYPKVGGSQFIADRLSEGLNIKCECPIENIEITSDNKLRIAADVYDSLIYTADIRKMPDLLRSAKHTFEFDDAIRNLRSNGTSSVLCSCDANDLSWLYIPESEFKAHRIIYTGNFSESNNISTSNRSSCTVEFSGICSFEEMKAELKKLPGNLTPISYNNEPNSYVIQDADTRILIQKYKEYLSTYNIYLLGRFAEWEYYNMDKAMEAAFMLKEQLDT